MVNCFYVGRVVQYSIHCFLIQLCFVSWFIACRAFTLGLVGWVEPLEQHNDYFVGLMLGCNAELATRNTVISKEVRLRNPDGEILVFFQEISHSVRYDNKGISPFARNGSFGLPTSFFPQKSPSAAGWILRG